MEVSNMKTAEEWEKSVEFHAREDEVLTSDWIELIKAIQLDAWKQGMTDAANLCKEGANVFTSMGSKQGAIGCEECASNIKEELDNKTII